MNGPQSVRSLNLKGSFGGGLAISSRAEHLALVVANLDRNSVLWRLIVLRADTLEVEHDVTDLVSRSELGQVSRLRISGTGNRLAVEIPPRFVVIDLPSHKVLMEEQGRFPALSPDGESLAFVDDRKRLVVVNLATGARRTLLSGWLGVLSIGAWSPDGTYLLANVPRPLRFSVILVAVECATDRYAEVMPLGEIGGGSYVWVKRELLQPLPPYGVLGH
jgi:hypothetical protein